MPSLSADEVSARMGAATMPTDVDDVVGKMVAEGELSSFIENVDGWPTLTIRGGGHTLKLKVSPTYASLGKDAYPIGRATPFLAQSIARRLRSYLPSRKVVLEAQQQSDTHIPYIDVKLAPYNIPGTQIATQSALDAAAKGVRQAFADRSIVPGDGIVYGYRKSIASGPKLDGSQVPIVGGVWSDGKPVQSYSTVHSAKGYADDSHGLGPFVYEIANLDGRDVSFVDDVMLSDDPTVVALVNDYHSTKTGALERYDPNFPNQSAGSATFSVASGDDDTDTDFSSFGMGGVVGAKSVPMAGAGLPPLGSTPSRPLLPLGGITSGIVVGAAVGGPIGAAIGAIVGGIAGEIAERWTA